MSQHVGVDVAECAVRAMDVAVVERLEDAAFEVGPGMSSRDRSKRVFRQSVTADAEHIGLDARSDKCDLGVEELRDPRRRVQGNAQPYRANGVLVGSPCQQEIPRGVGAVDLEARR